MTLWKRAMDYLGLGPDDPYDDYDMPNDYDAPRGGRPGRPAPQQWEAEPMRGRPRGGGWEEDTGSRPAPARIGQPVIINLEGTGREVSRRLIDFASGLCYGLNGSMEKVATGVYLLKPTGGHHYAD